MKRKATTTKKKTVKRQKTVPRSLAFQANTVSLRPEKKNIDVNGQTISMVASSTAWVLGSLLIPVAQGPTEVERIGRKMQSISMRINYTAGLVPTSTGGGVIRFKVIYDKQPNGAAPAITDIFANNDIGGANNLAFADRFITLIDHFCEPISVQNNYSVTGQITRKLGLDTMWAGSAGIIANITTGSIYVLAAQNGYINTAGPNLELDTRIRFIDT